MTRRGTIYLLVLVTASVTVALGMLAVFAAASQREMQELSIQRELAAARAESAIHLAVARIESLGSWRSLPSGRLVSSITLESGALWAVATDEDGVLDDDPDDAFTITAAGTFGRAKQRMAADFRVAFEPVEALEYAMVARGGITSVSKLSLDFGEVTFAVSLPLLDSLNPWSGSRSMSAIELPDPSVIAQYKAIGTVLPMSMSQSGTGSLYEELLLTIDSAESKADRTVANAAGVYVINGRGGAVRLTDLRVVGTLVVVNATSVELSTIRTMRPAAEGYPVLLTAAPLTIDRARSSDTDDTIPDKDDTPGGTDFDDVTFDGVQGLIFADNSVTLSNGLDMHGTLMATGEIFVTGETNIRRNDAFLESPPPGFRNADGIALVAGSWRAVVD